MPRILLLEATPIKPDGTLATVRLCSAQATSAATQLDGKEWLPLIISHPTREISYNEQGLLSEVAISHGSVTFRVHSDYSNEIWSTYDWTGALARIWKGDDGDAWASYTKVFEGSTSALSRSESRATVTLLGKEAELDRPLLTLSYAGTGSAEGPSNLRGVLKPWASGYCKNVEPVLIDPVNWVYQVHGYGAVNDIPAVYENAIQLATVTATHTTYAGLIGEALVPGQWAKCPTLGMFRLGAQPSQLITADVQGAKEGATYHTSVDTIVGHLIRTAAPSSSVGTLTAFASKAWNYYTREQVTAGEVARGALYEAGGILFPDGDGTWQVSNYFTTKTTVAISEDRSTSYQVLGISELTAGAPVWKVRAGYDRCWRRHSDSEISEALSIISDDLAAAEQAAQDAQAAADAAQISANVALGQLTAIVTDNVLDRSEKAWLAAKWAQYGSEKAGINTQASALGITTENTAYNSAYDTLNTYLTGLTPAYNNLTADTAITRTTFNTNWNAFETAKQALLNKLAAVAATKAGWSNITNDNGAKPADYATKNVITRSGTTPTSPTDGDVWVDTSVTPNLVKVRVSGAWQTSANYVTQGTDIGVANGATKNTIYRQGTAPTSPIDGDVWNDTSVTPNVTKIRIASAWQIAANYVTQGTDIGVANGAGTALTLFEAGAAGYTINGNSVTKSSGGFTYNIYSREFHVGTAFVSGKLAVWGSFIGLSDDQDATATNAHLGIEYAWHYNDFGNWWIYENGTQVTGPVTSLNGVTFSTNTRFLVTYDGVNVRYYADGVLMRTTATTAGRTFWAAVNCGPTASVTEIQFGPYTDNAFDASKMGTLAPANNATVNNVTYSTSAPSSPVNGDVWINTAVTPNVTNVRVSGAWQIAANYVTNTNQVTDGANLGGTANWTGVASRPANLSALAGTENINNASIAISSGTITGIGTGTGTTVANSSITIDGTGTLLGIGTVSKKVDNAAITVASGVLTGIGTSSVEVDNSRLSVDYDLGGTGGRARLLLKRNAGATTLTTLALPSALQNADQTWAEVAANGGSTIPANNAGSTVTLIPTGGTVTVTGNTVKNAGYAWGHYAYTSQVYVGSAVIGARLTTNSALLVLALESTLPAVPFSGNPMWGWYVQGIGSAAAFFDNGGYAAGGPTLAAGDFLSIEYDGVNVRWLRNGTVVRTATTGVTRNVAFHGVVYINNLEIVDVDFKPGNKAAWLDIGNTPTELTDGRVSTALNSSGKLRGYSNLFTSVIVGVRNTNNVTLTSDDFSSAARISVPAHARKVSGESSVTTISYNSGTITGLSYSTTYYVYVDDPNTTGGAVTYIATTNSDNTVAGATTGRVFVGYITTAAPAGSSSGGGGGYAGGGGGGGVIP